MKTWKIVQTGSGPRIEGTRITVYTIYENLQAGRTRDSIAAILRLSSAQVQAAIDYICENEQPVREEFERIMARIRKGNPPEVLAKLEASRKRFQALLSAQKAGIPLPLRPATNGALAELPLEPVHIVQTGSGPRIAGTRITVYAVLEYLRAGRPRDYIAMALSLSSRQVQAAIDYIREHEAEVNEVFERIMARIRKGNPPEIEAILQRNREKLQAMLAEREAGRAVSAS